MSKNVINRIRAFNQNRIPEMVAIKYRNMRTNALAFFRGSCHLFYADWPLDSELNSAPLTWLCGDLHLENFGTYKGENRLVYFDINDFDDGVLGPCTWDLARFLTSLNLAGAMLGLAEADTQSLCSHFLDTYFATLARGQIHSLERASATGLIRKLMRALKSRRRSKFLDQRSRLAKKGRRFKIETDRYLPVSKEDYQRLAETIHALGEQKKNEKFFSVHDVAFRVAGTGSLGLKRYAVLVEGRGSPDENFILDVKEERPSSLAANLKIPQPNWPSQAHRAVAVQMRMQAMPPALLTPLQMDGRWYIVRELQPSQDKINLADWDKRPGRIQEPTASMAQIIAWSQLRSGGRDGSAIADALIAFGEQAALKTELLQYAQRYTAQVQKNFKTFSNAYDAGKKI
jgi:uncharacterized protein (DUF2252 family)